MTPTLSPKAQRLKRALEKETGKQVQLRDRGLYLERQRELAKKRRISNPEEQRASMRNRRARKLAAGGSHTARDISNIMKMQRSLCAYCKKKICKNYHVDHIIPLARKGTNDRRNIQLLCPPCNLRKSSKDPIDFAQSIGKLI